MVSPPLNPETFYGIIKAPEVIKFLKEASSDMREKLEDAIVELQANPTPEGVTTIRIQESRIHYKDVSTTTPKYLLIYMVDALRLNVFIVSFQERNFA